MTGTTAAAAADALGGPGALVEIAAADEEVDGRQRMWSPVLLLLRLSDGKRALDVLGSVMESAVEDEEMEGTVRLPAATRTTDVSWGNLERAAANVEVAGVLFLVLLLLSMVETGTGTVAAAAGALDGPECWRLSSSSLLLLMSTTSTCAGELLSHPLSTDTSAS
jgi:hypothetical protein